MCKHQLTKKAVLHHSCRFLPVHSTGAEHTFSGAIILPMGFALTSNTWKKVSNVCVTNKSKQEETG